MYRSTFLALAAAAAAAIATPAAAQADSVTIGYGDLNLASQAGRAVLDQRIDGAARQLCGEFSPLELKMLTLSRTCRASVHADARAQLARVIVDDQFAAIAVSRAAL
ncbi:MAG TPA: UrcA family protein [Allosphingosinicella sp.]|nr:UrcA family protein [Allosphingosinicella sp.]